MINVYNSLGYKNFFEKKENQQKLIDYVTKNGLVISGFEHEYINAYENVEDKNGIQFVVEKGKEKIFKEIKPHITNNDVWKLRILESKTLDYFLCENAITNQGKCAINILNKDILPSYSRYDSFEVQVSGFNCSKVKLFTKNGKIKTDLARDVCNDQTTALFKINFSEESVVKDDRLNVICGIVYRFGKCDNHFLKKNDFYFAGFRTHFGDFTLYFPKEDLIDEENLLDTLLSKEKLNDYVYIESLCSIQGDAYLSDERSRYQPNYENNLSLCRRAFNEEEYNFLYNYLREDCKYKSNNWQLNGRDEILKKFKEISTPKCNIEMEKILLLSTDNEEKKKYEGKEILLYTEEGKDVKNPFYVETDENGKIYNIEMDSNSIAHWGVNYSPSVYWNNLAYIENIEKKSHEEALKKINSLEFNENFDTYFEILCSNVKSKLNDNKFSKKKSRDVHYFSTVKISKNVKDKQYDIVYNRSNNFGVDDLLFYNYLLLLFNQEKGNKGLKSNYYKNRIGIKFAHENEEIFYNFDDLKKIYDRILKVIELLSNPLDKKALKNKILFLTIDTSIFPSDITYKYLSTKGKIDVFEQNREELIRFYKEFIKKMTILINVAKKNECNYVSLIISH
ncbi:MAG: hypothetical protein IKR57_01160 [Bacilli bacterium]|nr:hypothetical protein [Bacilli bacterium]